MIMIHIENVYCLCFFILLIYISVGDIIIIAVENGDRKIILLLLPKIVNLTK